MDLDLLKISGGGPHLLPQFWRSYRDFALNSMGAGNQELKICGKKYFPPADGHQIRYANPGGGPQFLKNIDRVHGVYMGELFTKNQKSTTIFLCFS
jgi:hypothetical protein